MADEGTDWAGEFAVETWGGTTEAITLDPATFANIKRYWTHGEGAAKIRWGTDGSFKRCVRKLRKYFPQDTEGLCANMHKEATGEWPAEKPIPS